MQKGQLQYHLRIEKLAPLAPRAISHWLELFNFYWDNPFFPETPSTFKATSPFRMPMSKALPVLRNDVAKVRDKIFLQLNKIDREFPHHESESLRAYVAALGEFHGN